jgi:hypothetical protein
MRYFTDLIKLFFASIAIVLMIPVYMINTLLKRIVR